MQASLHWNNR